MKFNPLWRTALNYGAISGICSFAVFLTLYYKGVSPLGPASWLGAWIPVVFICIATKYYRDRILGGYIHYWAAYKTGVVTALCASFLFALMIYCFTKIYDSTIVDAFKEDALKGMEEAKYIFSDVMYETGVEQIENITISSVATNDFFTKLLGAVLVSFITAAAYRKLKSEIEE